MDKKGIENNEGAEKNFEKLTSKYMESSTSPSSFSKDTPPKKDLTTDLVSNNSLDESSSGACKISITGSVGSDQMIRPVIANVVERIERRALQVADEKIVRRSMQIADDSTIEIGNVDGMTMVYFYEGNHNFGTQVQNFYNGTEENPNTVKTTAGRDNKDAEEKTNLPPPDVDMTVELNLKLHFGQGNEGSKCITNAFNNMGLPIKSLTKKGNGIRKGLLIGNTYKNSKDPLKGCAESTKKMKKSLGKNLKANNKVPFDCESETNLSVSQIEEEVEDICKKADDESAEALLIYICGHGDHEPLHIMNDNAEANAIKRSLPNGTDVVDGTKYIFNNNEEASVREGGNFIWGDIKGKLEGKLYKTPLIATICKATPNVTHRIIIFDCCRGDRTSEEKPMSSLVNENRFTLDVHFSKLKDLSNIEYKNTYVFHSTLPHQVAWCGVDSQTIFSKYFFDFVGGKGGLVDINCLDVAINAAIKSESGKDNHVQMVELTKWVDMPFSW